VGFAAARRQKVEIAVRSRNEAVDAGADKEETVIVDSPPLRPPNSYPEDPNE
jgi:hypothetical protein